MHPAAPENPAELVAARLPRVNAGVQGKRSRNVLTILTGDPMVSGYWYAECH